MLKNLHIKNFAIISDSYIDFNNSLNIITGETGSGKSLVIKAIMFVFGKKISRQSIRTGESELSVSATIIINRDDIYINRVLSDNGKTTTFINNQRSSILELNNLLAKFHNYFGQEQQHELRDSLNHLHFIDMFGMYNFELDSFNNNYNNYNKLRQKIKLMESDYEDYNNNKDLYSFQLDEINDINIDIKKEEDIYQELSFYNNFAKIKDSIETIQSNISNNQNSALSLVSKSKRLIEDLLKTSNNFNDIYKRFDSVIIDLDDINNDLSNYLDTGSLDQKKIQELSESIDKIESLKRKYGGTIDAVIAYKNKIINILENGLKIKRKLADAIDEYKKIKENLIISANELSYKRKRAAKKFDEKIISNLMKLGMSNIKFVTLFADPSEEIKENGIDSCKFLISANDGEDIRSLSDIASGGELSRIMLAFKMSMQNVDPSKLIIFDEVDSGISGETAIKVGESIKLISDNYQVICVTHLPQIAIMASRHFSILKSTNDGRTYSVAKKLSNKEINKEINLLMTGNKGTKAINYYKG